MKNRDKKREWRSKDIWKQNILRYLIYIDLDFQKKKKKDNGGEKSIKAMSEDFSKLMNIYTQIQDQQKYDITVKIKKHRKPQIIRIL